VDPLTIGALGMIALFALIILKVPIGVAMMVVGVIGFGLQTNWISAGTLLASEPSNLLASVDLATLPLFLLMGTFANAAGFSADIYALAASFLGHRRGGLAYATIGGCAAFGAVCGSSTATAATFAKIALPEMRRRNYSPSFAAGAIAAGGTLKALIPPSLIMILYCIIAQTFIYDLFAAAIIPALITIALNLITVNIAVRLNPSAAPIIERESWSARLAALRNAAPALVLMLAVFGGLYSGIFTVNEAASVAAVLAFVFAIIRKRLHLANLFDGVLETARVSAMLYVVLMGATIFTYFITLGRVPDSLIKMVASLHMSPTEIILLILLADILLGTVFDELSAMLITLPFVLPIVTSLGYDPLWWGVIMVIQIELALIHPPFGIIAFLIHGIAPSISLKEIYLGVTPYLIADFTLLLLLVLFPQLALWLPHHFAP
jgi:tripartite ATP-independent transporter DctM subunit